MSESDNSEDPNTFSNLTNTIENNIKSKKDETYDQQKQPKKSKHRLTKKVNDDSDEDLVINTSD